MFTSLVLAAGLLAPAAPAPKPPSSAAGTAAGGRPPRLLELKADADGKVRVTVLRPNEAGGAGGVVLPGGGQARPAIARIGGTLQRVELSELTGLSATTVGGQKLTKEEALKALVTGGVVLVPADGKSVPEAYLRLFKDNVLILTSPDLMNATMGSIGFEQGGIRVGPGNWGPNGAPVPNAVPGGVLPLPPKASIVPLPPQKAD